MPKLMMSCVPTCSGADEFTSHTEQEEMRKIEKQLKNRFPVGSMVSEQRIVQDFLQQVTCVCMRACVLKLYVEMLLRLARARLLS